MSDRLRYLSAVLDYNNSIRMAMRRGVLVPMIQVTNSDPRHIKLFALTFGGKVTTRSNGLYVFQRSHGQAVEVVRKARPHLILNCKVADEVLDWKPAEPKKREPARVPCPQNCGHTMTSGSETCLACFYASERRKQAMFKPQKPAPRNFLIEPPPLPPHEPVRKLENVTRTGVIVKTPTGIVHRMRG